MASTPILIAFELEAETMLSCGASSYGIGAAVLQKKGACWVPVAHTARTLSLAEQRYAQIEKEALAIRWGYNRFSYYLTGSKFNVGTDQKPLVSMLSDNQVSKLPIKVQ